MKPTVDAILADFDASLPLERATTIPGSWYTDERIAVLERTRVFHRTWQLVGRISQVDRPGQYLTAEVGGEPIVVVRGSDGVLRAFFNVCRHHAAAVCTEAEGCVERLRCPYHGWVYGLDGRWKSAPEFDEVVGFDPSENGLMPVAVDTWESFVFVRVEPGGRSLAEDLGDLVRRVEPLGFGRLRWAGRREYTLGCNWKVFVDNYLDGGYHVPFLHRGLSSVLSHRDYRIEVAGRVCHQSSPIEASEGEAGTAGVRAGHAHYFWLYPNLMLNAYEGYLDTNLVLPLGVDRTSVVFDFYFDDVSEAARDRNQRSMEVSGRIQDEDHAICESVQRGLGSRAYDRGRLSVRREAGENLFHRLLAGSLRDPGAARPSTASSE